MNLVGFSKSIPRREPDSSAVKMTLLLTYPTYGNLSGWSLVSVLYVCKKVGLDLPSYSQTPRDLPH